MYILWKSPAFRRIEKISKGTDQVAEFSKGVVAQLSANYLRYEQEEEVEDVISDSLYRFCRGGFREECSPSTFGYVVSKNVAANVVITKQRERSRKSGVVYPALAYSPSPEDLLEFEQEFKKALGNMQPEIREALVEDARGRTVDEVALTSGVPTGTCKSRLHRARKQLGKHMGKDWDYGLLEQLTHTVAVNI